MRPTWRSTLACLPLVPLALLLLAAPTEAQSHADRNSVELALSGHERIPTKQALLRMGDDVAQVLRAIVNQPSHRLLARTRAISMLRFFPSKATTATLLGVIEQNRKIEKPSLAAVDLQQALISYATVVGPKAVETCKGLLAHKVLDVRSTAAEAVRLTKSPQALELLLKRQQVEPSPLVRYQIGKQIKLLSKVKATTAN